MGQESWKGKMRKTQTKGVLGDLLLLSLLKRSLGLQQELLIKEGVEEGGLSQATLTCSRQNRIVNPRRNSERCERGRGNLPMSKMLRTKGFLVILFWR